MDRREPVPVPTGDGRHDIGDDVRAAIFRRLHDDWTLAAPWMTAEQRRQLAMFAAASVRALLHELGTLRDLATEDKLMPEAEALMLDAADTLTHYGSKGAAECGADVPNMGLTTVPAHVTCPTCRGWLPIVAPREHDKSCEAELTGHGYTPCRCAERNIPQ